MFMVLYSWNLLREEIFANSLNLLSAEIFAIFEYYIHNKKHIEDTWIQKCVLALISANAFEITKSAKLKAS